MIELKNNTLSFSFPEVHRLAKLDIAFQRTLRIPDDDKVYPLPPGLGNFPIVHVDDFASKVAAEWVKHGGVILPMYQAEAMWLSFLPFRSYDRGSAYPFAIKILTGKIDAITGEEYRKGLHRNPQDYCVSPGQPWLDGYCVKRGTIRQFVAMPLGEGYTAEEQITKKAEHGGLQIVVCPLKASVFERLYPECPPPPSVWGAADGAVASSGFATGALPTGYGAAPRAKAPSPPGAAPMGIAPGGRMKQEIYKDTFKLEDWDLENSSRCFVHIANSAFWQSITGEMPPHLPPSAHDYARCGMPWFEYYDDNLKGLPGSSRLANMQSVQQMSKDKGSPVSNESVESELVVAYRKGLGPNQVRESDF